MICEIIWGMEVQEYHGQGLYEENGLIGKTNIIIAQGKGNASAIGALPLNNP